MKSRTSFFNFRVLGKDLTRFAPLWVLYAVAEVLFLMTVSLDDPGMIANDLVYVMGAVSVAHMGYAFLVAACLFGDLFDPRLCNGLHAMPIRREGWLLTHFVSGLLFGLIPALIGGGFAMVMLEKYCWMALVWQATSLLQYLFFFGLAVFSAMCAGKRLGMAAIYATLNFLSMLVYWIGDLVYVSLLPGVVLSGGRFRLFCPVATFCSDTYVNFDYDKQLGGIFSGYVAGSWQYLYLCAALGVVFMMLAWLLYRKRALETAGDFVSFRPLRVFFLVAYTLTAGGLVYSFHYIFGTNLQNYAFLVIGIVLGWFTGWMLLERTVKVFTPKIFAGILVFGALFAVSLGITYMDPAGIAAYIPKTEKVQTACLYTAGDSIRYESNYESGGRILTDPEEIRLVQELHRQMMETPQYEDRETINITVRYELSDGIFVYRNYDICAETEVAENISRYLSNVHSIFKTNDWQMVKDRTDYIRIHPQSDGMNPVEITDGETICQLLDAIKADCEAGTLAQHDYLHPEEKYLAGMEVNWIWVSGDGNNRITRGEYITVYENCENLNNILSALDIIS